MITELRRYRLKPDKVDSWVAFFEETLAHSERRGIRVEYAGLDPETATFIWLRSFADEADRARRKDAFYGDAWWAEREAFAMGHVLEYDVTFLAAVIVREGGELVAHPLPVAGEPAGSRADAPPEGWSPSTRRTFVPVRVPRTRPLDNEASAPDATPTALRQYRGDVIQATLDSEAEEALRETPEPPVPGR